MFRVSEPASSSIDKDARIAELEAALAARDTLIDTLRHQLAQLRRMTFGQSSEKLKLKGIEPQAYIADVIDKIAGGWPASRWDELMPWSWTADVAPVSMAA